MNRNDYTNIARGWEYIEDLAYSAESERLHGFRRQAEEAGFKPGSAAQAGFLEVEVHQLDARSVIVLGTGPVVETVHLMEAIDSLPSPGFGQLTAVDSSSQGALLIRRMFNALQDTTRTRLRVVDVKPELFLPRLNAGDYDMIVVTGDARNYVDVHDRAFRLLRGGGALILCDVLAQEGTDARGGLTNPADRGDKAMLMRSLLETVRDDERFVSSLISVGTGLLISIKK